MLAKFLESRKRNCRDFRKTIFKIRLCPIFDFLSFQFFCAHAHFFAFCENRNMKQNTLTQRAVCCKEHVWGFAMVECALAFWSLGGLRSARL
jgi:hypothetical protein